LYRNRRCSGSKKYLKKSHDARIDVRFFVNPSVRTGAVFQTNGRSGVRVAAGKKSAYVFTKIYTRPVLEYCWAIVYFGRYLKALGVVVRRANRERNARAGVSTSTRLIRSIYRGDGGIERFETIRVQTYPRPCCDGIFSRRAYKEKRK